ncbi:MAG TPA: hypothetical protein VGL02_19805 [Streptomyces sp.]
MSYLVTAFAAAVTSLTGRRLWWMLVSTVRVALRLAEQRQAVLLAVRVLAAGGDVEWRLRRQDLDVRISSRPGHRGEAPEA